MRRKVVLPAPFRPRSDSRSPRRMERETPRKASTCGPMRPRYTLRTSSAWRGSSVTRRCRRTMPIKIDSDAARASFSRRPVPRQLPSSRRPPAVSPPSPVRSSGPAWRRTRCGRRDPGACRIALPRTGSPAAGLAVLAAARGLDVLFDFFRVVVRFARRAIENSPRCKTGPTFKDDSRDAGAGRPFQPEAHEDLVDVGSANPDVSAADAFLDEAEGLVQPAGPVVRRKDREFRFLEALRSHPLEDSLHQEATESDFPPPVPDDDA